MPSGKITFISFFAFGNLRIKICAASGSRALTFCPDEMFLLKNHGLLPWQAPLIFANVETLQNQENNGFKDAIANIHAVCMG